MREHLTSTPWDVMRRCCDSSTPLGLALALLRARTAALIVREFGAKITHEDAAGGLLAIRRSNEVRLGVGRVRGCAHLLWSRGMWPSSTDASAADVVRACAVHIDLFNAALALGSRKQTLAFPGFIELVLCMLT